MLENPPRFNVLNTSVHLLEDYKNWLSLRLKEKIGTHVVTLNAEMAMLCDRNPELAQLINKADLVIPDGAGVVFYLRLRGQKVQRCPGIELAQSLIEENPSLTCFYGGKQGVAVAAANYWQEKIPRLSVITNHGYLDTEALATWQNTLKEKQPSLILVALGVPRQEFWIEQNRHLCPNSIWIGVGGSFDIWAGEKTRAPVWLRENNLEWLYRLYQEPWRAKRMLVLPQFFWRSFSG